MIPAAIIQVDLLAIDLNGASFPIYKAVIWLAFFVVVVVVYHPVCKILIIPVPSTGAELIALLSTLYTKYAPFAIVPALVDI